ncbi:MAG TPA: DNA alkylation repair protein [Steroidobacteraceae bacterium]|jgi:3-methyladenine DNA glycosylase AlkD|nr:DNA alkylation repair protein [Steroidobacteraceae bacterium]
MLPRLRKALRAAADPRKAPAMQAYMKSDMPYHGVPTPLLRQLCRSTFAPLQFTSAAQWQDLVLDLWRRAKYREERYAAMFVAGDARALPFQTPAAMKLYEELIVTGAWWDYVDDIAAHRVGPILRDYPAPLRRRMLAWSRSDNLWKRRTSIICQLGFKQDTDLELLYACIEPSLDSREFFLRKAIGWALRQYARTDPAEVKRYVRRNRERLSGLSLREAQKHLG